MDLVAGQQVVAVVDGFGVSDHGEFELVVLEVAATEIDCGNAVDDDHDDLPDCADPECSAEPGCTGNTEVVFTNVVTSPGCFTFSSPDALGPVADYTDDAGAVTLDFVAPTWPAEFDGGFVGNDLCSARSTCSRTAPTSGRRPRP